MRADMCGHVYNNSAPSVFRHHTTANSLYVLKYLAVSCFFFFLITFLVPIWQHHTGPVSFFLHRQPVIFYLNLASSHHPHVSKSPVIHLCRTKTAAKLLNTPFFHVCVCVQLDLKESAGLERGSPQHSYIMLLVMLKAQTNRPTPPPLQLRVGLHVGLSLLTCVCGSDCLPRYLRVMSLYIHWDTYANWWRFVCLSSCCPNCQTHSLESLFVFY